MSMNSISGLQNLKTQMTQLKASSQGFSSRKGDSVSIGGNDGGIADLKKKIEELENLKKIQSMFGKGKNTDKIEKSIQQKKELLEKMKTMPPPQQFDDDLKAEIAVFLDGKAKMPDGISDENKEPLNQFKSLIQNGMTFSDFHMQNLMPEDAFARLMGTRFHSMDNQVMYKTSENDMIKMSTFRPEYLKPLEHFIKYSKKGFVFHRKTGNGFDPVTDAGKFIDFFRDNPEKAVVQADDGSFVLPGEAMKIRTQMEIEQMIPDKADNGVKPEIIDEGNIVIIGGVVLNKRK